MSRVRMLLTVLFAVATISLPMPMAAGVGLSDVSWTIGVAADCDNVTVSYDVSGATHDEYWIVLKQPGLPDEELTPPSWPSGEFVLTGDNRYGDYWILLVDIASLAYVVEGTLTEFTVEEPAVCTTPPEPPVLSNVSCIYDEGGGFLSFGVSWTVGEGEQSRVGSNDATPSDDTGLSFFGDEVPASIFAYHPISKLTSGPATVTADMLPECGVPPPNESVRFEDVPAGQTFFADIEVDGW